MIQYELLAKYIKAWKRSKDIHGLIVCGPVATGKSYEVEKALEGEECVLINSHVTPMKLYIQLYNTKNSYLIIDDVLGLFKSKDTSGLLIAATQTGVKPRIITWHTTSEKLELPCSFEYRGKVAIICNNLPKNLQHLKSRCFYYELKLNYQEMLSKISEVAEALKIPSEIVEFIKENSDPSMPQDVLNLRLLMKLNTLYKEFPDNWKQLGYYVMTKDKRMYILKSILENYRTVEEQIKIYEKITGRKKSSFYKDKQILERKVL